MELTKRQLEIVEIVKKNEPITGDEIGEKLKLTRSALRTDFSILKKIGILKSKQKIGYTYNEKFIEVQSKSKVKDIMGEPITIEEKASVYETVLLMFEKDAGTIFVTKEEELVGIVSRKDLLRVAIGKRNVEQIPINLIMTRMPKIIYVLENDPIEKCIRKIIEKEIDAVPVVKLTKEGKVRVVGRCTKTNISKYCLELVSK